MTRRGITATILGTFITVTAASCTETLPPPRINIPVEPVKVDPPRSPKEKQADLRKALEARGVSRDQVADVRYMLQAQAHEKRGNPKKAQKKWFKALNVARGAFGREALEGWIRTYGDTLERKIDIDVLARLLLAETGHGKKSPYMEAEGLTTRKDIRPVIRSTVPDVLKDGEARLDEDARPPKKKTIPDGDPVLKKAWQKRCRVPDHKTAKPWEKWAAQALQKPAIRTYWQGFVHLCEGEDDKALEVLEANALTLSKTEETLGFAVEAYGKVAQLQRRLGQRPQAADTYLKLVDLWEDSRLEPQDLGLKPTRFRLRRINETLWASRYRAFVGDYETGKKLSQKALDMVSRSYADPDFRSKKLQEELAMYKAEAYHILAYRIAVETRKFASAASLSRVALESAHLEQEWRERLLWLTGVYQYLDGSYEKALDHWEEMLSQDISDELKPRLYYWLARAYEHLDRPAESRFYLSALTEDYPLSYYAVVAPQEAGITPKRGWKNVFGTPESLSRRFRAMKDYDLRPLRRDRTVGRLLERAETLVTAELDHWSRLAADELADAMRTKYSYAKRPEPFLYLTRIQFAAGDYISAVRLTTSLANAVERFWQKWPHQIFVYFARPYAEIYKRNALENDVDENLLLAVSRQESAFTAHAQSHAKAVGVMQLIRPTAERMADQLDMSVQFPEDLHEPETNIALGSRYLKVLSLRFGDYEPALYGSYNAGENAMEMWLQRRAHSSRLMFVELIPFGETKHYVKNVWRNHEVYRYLGHGAAQAATLPKTAFLQAPPSR